MTVAELIKELEELPPDLNVTIWKHVSGSGPRNWTPAPQVRPAFKTQYFNTVPADAIYGGPTHDEQDLGEMVFL